MTNQSKHITVFAVLLVSSLSFQSAIAGNVLMTGWGTVGNDNYLILMENHMVSLGHTVTRSVNFPDSLDGFDVIVLMGGGGSIDVPEAVVDSFVNAGGGLLVFEGIVSFGFFDATAESNPVETWSGWDSRTGAAVIDSGHVLCTGLSGTCGFGGYSTNPHMKTGSHVIMVWNDQTVFAAARLYGSGHVVYVNYLGAWYYGYWSGDEANGMKLMENALAWIDPATGVEGRPIASSARDFTLFQNFPNPFNPSTAISYFLPEDEHVTLRILDVQGRTRRVLQDHHFLHAGNHTASWDGKDNHGLPVASGVYFYQIRAGASLRQGKMILTK